MLTILQGDALTRLRELPDESVHCCVTSPPFYGLRDYGTAKWEGGEADCDHAPRAQVAGSKTDSNGGAMRDKPSRECKCGAKRIDAQLGLEAIPDCGRPWNNLTIDVNNHIAKFSREQHLCGQCYVCRMVEIFREVRRVLRKDGTLWLNLGDSYVASPTGNFGTKSNLNGIEGEKYRQTIADGHETRRGTLGIGLPAKNLIGIPWRVAFALQADGWYLRSDIIWSKPNPMPESVTDRCTKAHEYLFLLTKSSRYFYDAEAIKEKSIYGGEVKDYTGNQKNNSVDPVMQATRPKGREIVVTDQRNKRSVWTVATAPYPEAHFATYPPDLIKPCILAGTSAKGCCVKCGSPWERITETLDSPTRSVKTNGPVGDHGFFGNNRRDIPKQIKTLGWRPTCECFGYFDQSKCEVERAKGSVPDGWNQRLGGHNDIVDFSRRERTEEKIDLSEKIIRTIKTYVPTSDAETVPCTVLDMFAGSGTTGAVALELGRRAILIELNPKYVELVERRCNVTMGLALA